MLVPGDYEADLTKDLQERGPSLIGQHYKIATVGRNNLGVRGFWHLGVKQLRSQSSRSNIPAAPMPPPTHIVTMP